MATSSSTSTLTNPPFISKLHNKPQFSPLQNPNFILLLNPTKLTLKSNQVSIFTKQSHPLPPNSSMADLHSQMGSSNFNVFDYEEHLALCLAHYVAHLSHQFVTLRGCFTLVLSGGSLIISLRKLLEPPFADSIDWSKWHVFWVDERVVPKDHPHSNYKLAYDNLLSKVPILPNHVYAINDTLPAEGAANDYETCLKKLVKSKVIARSPINGLPKFDLQLLGMGPDGHVASLFPGHPVVKEDKRWVSFIKDSPKPPPERITFTLPVINASSYIALVVCGGSKAGAVNTALGGGQTSDLLPVQLVSPEGELKWFLDREAAALL